MRILLTGKNGQVGTELGRKLASLGQLFAFDRTTLDLADPDRIVAAVAAVRPQIIVNAAAYTAVDKAESDADLARMVNEQAPGILAEQAERGGALLVHYSTDYVFDGSKSQAYDEEDIPNPINAYGRTKLGGERAIQATGCRHLIFRTSWVYSPHGGNFLLTMLRLGKEREELRIVDDQYGAPTSARAIADATLAALGKSDTNGLFHLTAAGRTSWCGFAREILKSAGFSTKVIPIQSADYPTAARRPLNSSLDCSKLRRTFGIEPPPWQDEMKACLRTIHKT